MSWFCASSLFPLSCLALLDSAAGKAASSSEDSANWKLRLLDAFKAAGGGETGARLWEISAAKTMSSANVADIERWMECRFIHELPFREFKSTRSIRLAPNLIANAAEAEVLKPRLMVVPKGLANVPHAHNKMVSMHFVLKGEAQLSSFSRDYLLEVPNRSLNLSLLDSRTVRPGDVICMTPFNANVHWFAAKSDFVTLCFPLGDLEAPAPSKATVELSDHQLIYVDPTRALKTERPVQAEIITETRSYELFLNRSLKFFT